jgi:hypothetical protein
VGNGDGTFQAPMSYDSGGWAGWGVYYTGMSVTVADVNGDGNPDLVVSHSCASGENTNNCKTGVVTVLLGNGDGSFQSPVAFKSGASHGQAIAVADVNNDGRPDVLVANLCNVWRCSGVDWTGGAVAVLTNNFTSKTLQ